MTEFIEECKAVLRECKKSGMPVKVNDVMFSHDFEFDFDEETEFLFIRFRVAYIGGIVASIRYDEIKSFG